MKLLLSKFSFMWVRNLQVIFYNMLLHVHNYIFSAKKYSATVYRQKYFHKRVTLWLPYQEVMLLTLYKT